MEITEIISDFEAGMKCSQNPCKISRIFSVSSIEEAPQVYSLWTWGALIFVLVATFTSIIYRIKCLIVRFRTIKFLAASLSEPVLQHLIHDDDDYSDEDSSSAASEDHKFESTPSFKSQLLQDPVDEDFCVLGSSYQWKNNPFKLQRRHSNCGSFSWADFAAANSVVKLWESLGLSLEIEESCGGVVSIWELEKHDRVSNFYTGLCQIPAVATPSPAVVLWAESNKKNEISLGVYDMRVGHKIPAMYSEWKPPLGNVAAIDFGGVEKVYLRVGVTGELTVGDMRNAKLPLDNLMESDVDTWCNAAVNFDGEFVDVMQQNSC